MTVTYACACGYVSQSRSSANSPKNPDTEGKTNMTIEYKPELAAALANALGVPTTPESAAADAKFAGSLLERTEIAFSRLAFEDEPSGFTAAQRRNAP